MNVYTGVALKLHSFVILKIYLEGKEHFVFWNLQFTFLTESKRSCFTSVKSIDNVNLCVLIFQCFAK